MKAKMNKNEPRLKDIEGIMAIFIKYGSLSTLYIVDSHRNYFLDEIANVSFSRFSNILKLNKSIVRCIML
jgi:hypothetical protein